MRIPDDVVEALDQNGVDVSSAWLWCDVDVYNELYGSPLVQPVSLEAVTINELRFLDSAGSLTIRMSDNANSLVLYASYVEFIEDSTGGNDGQTVAVDDITVDWNNASELEVKDAGITADKLAPGAVTNVKFADAPASTLKGRARGAGTGPVSDLTGTSVRPIVGDGWAGGQALVSDAVAGPVESATTATEIGHVHGVVESLQYQLDERAALTGVVDELLPELTKDGVTGTIIVPPLLIQAYNSDYFFGRPSRHQTVSTTLTLSQGVQYFVTFVLASDLSYSVQLVTDSTTLNMSNRIPLYVVSLIGTSIHSMGFDNLACGLPQKQEIAQLNTEPYRRSTAGGLLLSEDGSRHVMVSAAHVFAGTIMTPVLDYTSLLSNIVEVYHVSGVWMYTTTTSGGVYDNMYIDNGTNKVLMGNNKYKAVWFYRSIGDDREVFYLNGNAEYNSLADAQNAGSPMLPAAISWHVMLVGRILIQKGATSGVVQSAFEAAFSGIVYPITYAVLDSSGSVSHEVFNNPLGRICDCSFYDSSGNRFFAAYKFNAGASQITVDTNQSRVFKLYLS